MKKIVALCLSVILMMGMTITAFAAPGSFVSSPTGNQAPAVEDFKAADEDCTAQLVITPYGDREELSEAIEALLEKAYDSIKESTDLTALNAELAKLAKEKKINGTDLAVSDLFDIHVTGCDYHDGHTEFDVVLSADTLNNFVALIHMNKDGKWEIVEDAKVTGDGDHLSFSVDSFSPFAIIVNTGKPAQTGDNNMVPICIAIMAVSALAIVVILVRSKKQKA